MPSKEIPNNEISANPPNPIDTLITLGRVGFEFDKTTLRESIWEFNENPRSRPLAAPMIFEKTVDRIAKGKDKTRKQALIEVIDGIGAGFKALNPEDEQKGTELGMIFIIGVAETIIFKKMNKALEGSRGGNHHKLAKLLQ